MLDKLKGIFETQKKMSEIKRNLESISVDYESAAGKIKVMMSGTQKLLSLDISDEFLKAEEKEKLQNELISSINAASQKVQRIAAEKLQASMGNLKIPGL